MRGKGMVGVVAIARTCLLRRALDGDVSLRRYSRRNVRRGRQTGDGGYFFNAEERAARGRLLDALPPERRRLWFQLGSEFYFRMLDADEGEREAVQRRYRDRLELLGVPFPTAEDQRREQDFLERWSQQEHPMPLATDESRRRFEEQWKRDRAGGVRPWRDLLREARISGAPTQAAAVASLMQEAIEAIFLESWFRVDAWQRRRHGDQKTAGDNTHVERMRITDRISAVRAFAQETIDFHEGEPMAAVRPLLVAVAQELRDLGLREVDLRHRYTTPPGIKHAGEYRLANHAMAFLGELGFTEKEIATGLAPYANRMARKGVLTEKTIRDRLDKFT